MRATLFATLGGMLLAALPVLAHHSFAAEFDINQPITLKGVLTKMDWVNPHGWIYVDVTSADGKVVNWAVEAGGPTQLLRRGLRKTDFPPGLEVVVEGYRARSGEPKANGRTVTLKDGRNFFLGAPDVPGAPQ
jgi:hypothetical protein